MQYQCCNELRKEPNLSYIKSRLQGCLIILITVVTRSTLKFFKNCNESIARYNILAKLIVALFINGDCLYIALRRKRYFELFYFEPTYLNLFA